ncbi:MAG: DUF3592 domain-containing protein [Bacteroidota bacterium]
MGAATQAPVTAALHNKVVAKYPKGKNVSVFYDPENPQHSIVVIVQAEYQSNICL